MSQTVVGCPHCRQQLTISSDMAGKPLRCPRCQKAFAVQVTAAPPPPMPPPVSLPAAAPAPVATARAAAAPPPLPPTRVPGPGPAPVAASRAPAGPPPPETPSASPDGSAILWQRLAPAAVLALILGGIVVRDLAIKGGETEERAQAKSAFVAPLVDPEPLLLLDFDTGSDQYPGSMQFGLSTLREQGSDGKPKRLTYSPQGTTNYLFVKIDGRPHVVGRFFMTAGEQGTVSTTPPSNPGGAPVEITPGKWHTLGQDLGDVVEGAAQRKRLGKRSVYLFDTYDVYVSQEVEIIPGQLENGKRRLDTCLVKYTLENKGDQPRKAALRFVLDTLIGTNDGVPFTIPGRGERCNTYEDLDGATAPVPDFLQALEFNEPGKIGTVAHLTVKYGGALEAPNRVVLAPWHPLSVTRQYGGWRWDPPDADKNNKPFTDSAVALYWEEKQLGPHEQRVMGFAYGLGQVSSTEGSKLELTTAVNLYAHLPFAVTAYASNPMRGQEATLELPPGLELVQGPASQPVPPLKEGAAGGRSPVTWMVKAPVPGQYTLGVKSSTGEAKITVLVNEKNPY